MLDLTGGAVGEGGVRQLLVNDFLAYDIAGGEADSPVVAEGFGEVEVEGVVGHLVGVGYGDGIVAACESDAAPDTDETFADTVVEDGATPAGALVGVEETRIDEVGRLSLHGAGGLAGALGELHAALDKRTVERKLEAAHTHESEVFAEVEFQPVGVGTVGVLVTVGEVGAACNGVRPLDRVAEMLVESGDGDDFALVALGVELVAEVGVVDVAGGEVDITLHVGGEVEIVIDRGGDFAELGSVDGHTVGGAELVLVGDTVGDVGGGESVGGAVVGSTGRVLAVAGVADKAHIVVLVAHTGVDVHRSERHINGGIGSKEGVGTRIVVAPFDLLEEVETVLGVVVVLHQFGRYVELAEIVGEGVGRLVPVVVEGACGIVACAVLAIDTDT